MRRTPIQLRWLAAVLRDRANDPIDIEDRHVLKSAASELEVMASRGRGLWWWIRAMFIVYRKNRALVRTLQTVMEQRDANGRMLFRAMKERCGLAIALDETEERLMFQAAETDDARATIKAIGDNRNELIATIERIAHMPEYDQDDAHRLRGIARMALGLPAVPERKKGCAACDRGDFQLGHHHECPNAGRVVMEHEGKVITANLGDDAEPLPSVAGALLGGPYAKKHGVPDA